MYVGWALIQLGIGVAAGSGWVLATLPFVGAAVHREVLSEEQRLSEKFGDEYEAYCATVGRYLPPAMSRSAAVGEAGRAVNPLPKG